MRCEEVRPILDRGGALDASVLDHLESCDACAVIADERGLLTASFESDPVRDRALLAKTEAALSEERGLAAWLRSRPTPVRRAIASSLAIAIVLVAILVIRRPDFESYPLARMIATIVSLLLFILASLMVALRPVQLPALPNWIHRGLTFAGVLTALVLAVLPSGYEPPLALRARDLIEQLGLHCFVIGTLLGAPVYFVTRMLDRAASRLTALLAALAAGLTGDLSLHLHCPKSDPLHLLTGHFTVVIMFLIATLVVLGIRRRTRD